MCKPVFDKSIKLKDNSMLVARPDLFGQWDFKKNDILGFNVYHMTRGANFKVNWICEKGHEWEAKVALRAIKGTNCPICANRKILKGYNDIWTTNPELASLLADPEEGCKYVEWSNARVNWKCPSCLEKIENKKVSSINADGLSCPNCSDNRPYGEKVIFNLLRALGIDFHCQKVFSWSNRKKYDFYIEDKKAIIEVHGIQHYKGTFEEMSGITLEDELKNDKIKYETAMENNIEAYVVIDARKSNFEYIKNSIYKEKYFSRYRLDDLDWRQIEIESLKSLSVLIWEFHKRGFSREEISKVLAIKEETVRRHLFKGRELSLIDYRTKFSASKSVVKLTLEDEFVCEFETITKASKSEKISSTTIRSCFNGEKENYNGFKWMLKEDYEELIKYKAKI